MIDEADAHKVPKKYGILVFGVMFDATEATESPFLESLGLAKLKVSLSSYKI